MKLKNKLLLATAGTVLVVLGLAGWLSLRQTSAALEAHAVLMQHEAAPSALLASLSSQRGALFTKLAWLHVIHGFAVVLALTVVLTFLWHRLVLSRLRVLLQHMNWMSRGTWSETIPVHGDDEIAELTRAFNHLGDRLTETLQRSAHASKLAAMALLGQRLVKDVSRANADLHAAAATLRLSQQRCDTDLDPVLRKLDHVIGTLDHIPMRFEEDFDRQFRHGSNNGLRNEVTTARRHSTAPFAMATGMHKQWADQQKENTTMKTKHIWLSLLLITAWTLLSAGGSALAGEHQHEMKVGKKGAIVFSTQMKVGDLTLEPGPYMFQHRTEGENHFVRFTSKKTRIHTGEVPCRLEPLDRKSKQTAVSAVEESGFRRITRIVVRGENVAHLF